MKKMFLFVITLSMMIMLTLGCATMHPAAAFKRQVGVPVDEIQLGNLKVSHVYSVVDNDTLMTMLSKVEYHIPKISPCFYAIIDGVEHEDLYFGEIEYILLRARGFFKLIDTEKPGLEIKAYYDSDNKIIWAEVPNNLISGNFVFIDSENHGEDGANVLWTHVWGSPAAYIKGDVFKWNIEYIHPKYIPRGTP